MKNSQLAEHCTGIAEVMGSNPIQAWIFRSFLFVAALKAGNVTVIVSHLLIDFLKLNKTAMQIP